MGSMTVLRVVSHASAPTLAAVASVISSAAARTLLLERPMPALSSAKALEAASELGRGERLETEGEFMVDGLLELEPELVVSGATVVAHAHLRKARDLPGELFGRGARSPA